MNWKEILESLDDANKAIDDNNSDMLSDVATTSSNPMLSDEDMESIVNQLNQIFTPVLVMQNIEGDLKDQINEAMDNASVLTEKNMIKFDDATRMAQLISVASLLIEKQKNTDRWRTYQNAAIVKNKTKLDIQKSNYDAAKTIAQKYLVKVSTTNNSSVARNAANELLPQTQH